jgi:plasmid stabilization system protein ParE
MPKFEISFTPQAVDDILNSYQWGLQTWGENAAEKWLRELYRCIYDRLTVFPKSCPPAPESDELDGEVRQLIFLRYRILFEIDKGLVVVLQVDGPFTGSDSER